MKVLALALVGVAFALPAQADEALAKKYKGQNVAAQLEQKVKKGGQGVWGPIPMPPNAAVPDADIKKLVDWILKLG